MEKTSRLTAAAVLLGIASSVSATPVTFTDVVNPEPNIFISVNNPSFVWQHDLTDGGFSPATDTIVSASLLIELGDDPASPADGTERTEIYLDSVLVATSHNPVNDYSFVFAFPFTSLMDGLIDGVLSTIPRPGDGALGDFYYKSSILTVNVDRAVTISEAPEPSTIALFAVALVGLALRRRKHAA